jgi:hypothetical protein
MFHGWGAEEILALGKRVAKSAMDAVKAEVKEAIAVATLQDRLKGEIRRAGIEAGEAKVLEVVRADAPAVIHVPVRRAVQSVLTQAADQAEQEAIKVAGLPGPEDQRCDPRRPRGAGPQVGRSDHRGAPRQRGRAEHQRGDQGRRKDRSRQRQGPPSGSRCPTGRSGA